MKKLIITGLAVFMLICYTKGEVRKEKISFIYNTMRVACFLGTYADYTLTKLALERGAIESNPLARLYIHEHRAISLSIVTLAGLISDALFVGLYKRDRVVAYIVLGVFIALRAYAVYRGVNYIF